MNLENLSLGSPKAINPAAFEAWRDLGVLLKSVRVKAGLTKADLARKSGIGLHSFYLLERGAIRPNNKYLSAYDEAALSTDISPLEIFRAYEKAKNLEQGYTLVGARFKQPKRGSEIAIDHTNKNTTFEKCEKDDILEQAVTDPKALLMSARWLPQRAEDRMERITFYKEFIEKVDGIKEHCINLATEAQQMLGTYKYIGELFDTYAYDLSGRMLVKEQFYYGQTLDKVLETKKYTRRWAQTLQERTLKIFQQRMKELYDKRGIGAQNKGW